MSLCFVKFIHFQNGGVVKTIKKEGKGGCPPHGSTVFVHYVGTLENGDKFDSSRDRGEPFSFTLGKGSVGAFLGFCCFLMVMLLSGTCIILSAHRLLASVLAFVILRPQLHNRLIFCVSVLPR